MQTGRKLILLLRIAIVGSVGTLDESAIRLGLTYEFRDLEDAFVAAIAEQESASCIVTNNVRDFKASPVSVFTLKIF